MDIAIRSVHIDSDGAYLAAVNNKVGITATKWVGRFTPLPLPLLVGHMLCVEPLQWCGDQSHHPNPSHKIERTHQICFEMPLQSRFHVR